MTRNEMPKWEQGLSNAFLNGGLPQFAEKVYEGNRVYDFSKNEVREVRELVVKFDDYYMSGWKESATRKTLVNFINDWCETFRTYSLVIE